MKNQVFHPRKLAQTLKKMSAQFPAIAVTGPRQSGKSTLLKNLFPQCQYITFDDPSTLLRAKDDPEFFLDSLSLPVILDEIQYCPELLPYLKMHIDNNRQNTGQFFLTGSQQFTLMKNLTESMAGRIGLLELLPFSITELPYPAKTEIGIFTNASLRGLYPELITDKNISEEFWYSSYIQTYLEKDIRTIQNIGDIQDFQRLLNLLAARCSQQLNMAALSLDIGVAQSTIKRWISVLEASRIIYLLPPYFDNLGKRIIKAPKVYFLDTGLACHLLRITSQDSLIHSHLAGALFENFCIQEIVKHHLHHCLHLPLYYWRNQNRLEIDLIIEGKDFKTHLIEIKLNKTPKPKHAENIEKFISLAKTNREYSGSVISLTEDPIPLSRKVVVRPLMSFLDDQDLFFQ